MSKTQLNEKRKELQSPNTLKADKKADKLFSKWLQLQGIHTDYWDLPHTELDDLLTSFYFEARTQEGEQYKTSSLGALRYGINRKLREKGYEYDIVHSPEFKKSTAAFMDACKELKAIGKGDREHYKEIEPKGTLKKHFLLAKSLNRNRRKVCVLNNL